ncbi:MAG: recombination regulator RecX [Chloroflexota bacterium]|nr:recombination regulator RecX [Chloroflexota bacterium]
MDAAAAFLGVRPRSVIETRRRLRHLGYPSALVDTVVDRLVEMGYLDDASFARAWVESRDRARPRGEAALRRELALKGVARETIDEVLAARQQHPSGETADVTAALRLLARRRSALEREPDPRKRRQKAYALLARNGFDPEVCRTAAAGSLDPDDDG